jgi:hypothetical protein
VVVARERQKAEGRRQKVEGRRRKAEGGRQKAEGRRQKAEGWIYFSHLPYLPCTPAPLLPQIPLHFVIFSTLGRVKLC